jgi:hypothetical protein
MQDAWVEGYRSVALLSAEDQAELPTFVMMSRLFLTAWVGAREAWAPDDAATLHSTAVGLWSGLHRRHLPSGRGVPRRTRRETFAAVTPRRVSCHGCWRGSRSPMHSNRPKLDPTSYDLLNWRRLLVGGVRTRRVTPCTSERRPNSLPVSRRRRVIGIARSRTQRGHRKCAFAFAALRHRLRRRVASGLGCLLARALLDRGR